MTPALSVVIAATDSAPAVARTVASLRSRCEGDRVEIIVVAAQGLAASAGLPEDVRRIAAPRGTTAPRLRRLGLNAAGAPIVAFTEDSCVLDPGWSEAYLRAFDDPRVRAATGPVEPAMGDSPVDWAVFFCEYAPFLGSDRPRRHDAWVPRLAGNNFAVRRAGMAALEAAEIHEFEVHAEVAREGGAIRNVAGAPGRHVRRYSLCEAVGDRLRFGIEFGRLRAVKHSRIVNALAALAGPLIFAVQLARLSRAVARRRQLAGRFAPSLPVTLVLLSAWSVGESLGWTLGPAGLARNGRGTSARRQVQPVPRSCNDCRAGQGAS